MSKDWTLSIDFGTSNTAAAHTNPTRGGIEAVSLSQSNITMPSSVYIENPDSVSTGDVALNKAGGSANGVFIPSPKRVIPQQIIQINGYDVPASTPVAAVLNTVVERASREHNDQRPAELVLTHPEAWTNDEIKVLLDAAEQLGLNATTVKTVSEPKAAAQYYSTNQPLEPGDKIAVFDFGGGTLDVAVIETQTDGSFNIVAARGDDTIGGRSFDALIRRWVDQQLQDDYPEVIDYLKSEATREELHALEDSIRRAKELLSEAPTAEVSVPTNGQSVRLQITRDEFEALVRPKLRSAVAMTRGALEDAGITQPEDLKALYLTGGSSRVPIVQEELKQLGPVTTLDDPKLVVAQGAISAVSPIVTGLGSAEKPDTGAAAPVNPDTAAFRKQPSPASGPTTAASTQASKAGKSSKTPWIAAAAAALAAAVGIGAFVTLNNSGDSETAASGEDTAVSSTAPNSEAEETGPKETTAEGVYNALPADLQEATSGCNSVSYSTTNAFQIRCDMIVDGNNVELFRDLSPYDTPTVLYSIDAEEALRQRGLIKKGSYSKGTDVEPVSSADDAALAIATDKNEFESELHYANKETGLIIESTDFGSAEAALDWLRSHGLL